MASERLLTKQRIKYKDGRRCTYCHTVKPLDQFYIVKKSGYKGTCKPCDKRYAADCTTRKKFLRLGRAVLLTEIQRQKEHLDFLYTILNKIDDTKEYGDETN